VAAALFIDAEAIRAAAKSALAESLSMALVVLQVLRRKGTPPSSVLILLGLGLGSESESEKKKEKLGLVQGGQRKEVVESGGAQER
jgi:hypothetical protein